MKSRFQRNVLPVVCLTVLAAGLWVGTRLPFFVNNPPPTANGIVFDNPQTIGPFRLIDQGQRPFSTKNLLGHWSLVYFGFSHCGTPCADTLAELHRLSEQLAAEVQVLVQPIFVSVDPDRDTPERLAAFLATISPRLIGITGEKEQIRHLAAQLAAPFDIRAGPGDTYRVDHSNNILLVNPAGRFQAILTPPHDATRLAADFSAIALWQQSKN